MLYEAHFLVLQKKCIYIFNLVLGLKSFQILFQNQYLSTITRHLHNMVETSLDKLNDSTDLSMFESSYALKDLNDDLENQTTMVTTLADIFAHSGNSKYRYYILQWRFWKPSLSEEYI